MTAELRPYQENIIDKLRYAVASGRRKIICVAPTGAGKTVIAAQLIKEAAGKLSSVLVLAHRREIIAQTVLKLHDWEVECGVIQAGFASRSYELVQVASVQTLWSRAVRGGQMPLPSADLLVIDECHHAPARTYRKIVEKYPNAVLLGLTATPCRGDGRGLGGIFDAIVECPQVPELIEQGFLVQTRVYAPVREDIAKGVATSNGDYIVAQLAERMDQDGLVGDIVTHWHKYGERRRTVCFAVNVAHSLHIRNEFIASGVRAEHIDGSTPKPERDAVLARLASGETELVTNCMVLSEGWDLPAVGCCILARPTRQMGLYRQMVGRVLRPAPDKPDCIVLDHSGAVYKHGLVEDEVVWTLDPDKRAAAPKHAAFRSALGYAQRLIACTQCGAVRISGTPCGACGFLPARPPRDVEVHDGELGRYQGGRVQRGASDPRQWLAMLLWIGHGRGYQKWRGWAAHKFKDQVRFLAALGIVARANLAVARGVGLGQITRHRLRQGAEEEGCGMSRKWKHNRQTPETPSGQWCGRPREMLESAAYRVLSRAGHQVLSRIELELRYHGGKENGRLPVTFENFVDYGIERHGIAPAQREVQALGLAEITRRGRGGNAEHRSPNLFRLTYEPTRDTNPTNEWKRFAKGADPNADARMMAAAAKAAEMARKNQNLMLVARMKKSVAKKQKPVRETRTGTDAGNPHRNPELPDAGNPHYRVSGETRTTLDTRGRGRSPQDPAPPEASPDPLANGSAVPSLKALLKLGRGAVH